MTTRRSAEKTTMFSKYHPKGYVGLTANATQTTVKRTSRIFGRSNTFCICNDRNSTVIFFGRRSAQKHLYEILMRGKAKFQFSSSRTIEVFADRDREFLAACMYHNLPP